MLKIGSKIQIISDNENYDKYRKGTWKVSHIAHNRNEHPGYDEDVNERLVDCKGFTNMNFNSLNNTRSMRGKGEGYENRGYC